jgi:L-amino acid N-acyltransferase YncA
MQTTHSSETVLVRLAAQADLPIINDIYNHYVLHSTCTYQEEPDPLEAREQWFKNHGPHHPITVAEVDGQVVGWGSLSPYHKRSAYRFTVENSVYVHHAHHRRGIGSRLLEDLLGRARVLGHRAIIAVIDSSQTPSITLHKRCGFEHVGHFKHVGLKFGKWLDVTYMELLIDNGSHQAQSDLQI